jgi:hypothetical protein
VFQSGKRPEGTAAIFRVPGNGEQGSFDLHQAEFGWYQYSAQVLTISPINKNDSNSERITLRACEALASGGKTMRYHFSRLAFQSGSAFPSIEAAVANR